MAAWPATALLWCVQPAPEQTELYLRQPGNPPGFLREGVIQSIWEKWGQLPCILVSCPDSNPCSLALKGQRGCSRKQIRHMLCWIKIYIFIMIQNLEPLGLSWPGWHDSAKCQTATGVCSEHLGSMKLLWAVQPFWEGLVHRDDVLWISSVSPVCSLHLWLQRCFTTPVQQKQVKSLETKKF